MIPTDTSRTVTLKSCRFQKQTVRIDPYRILISYIVHAVFGIFQRCSSSTLSLKFVSGFESDYIQIYLHSTLSFVNHPKFRFALQKWPSNPLRIFMKNASFSWSAVRGSLPVLHDISMDVTPGSLVVVVGPVASGKSSLVSGVFGFAQLVAGKSILRGRNDLR